MTHTATFTDWPSAHAWLQRLAAWAKGNTLQGQAVTIIAKQARRTVPQNNHLQPIVAKIAKAVGRSADEESLRVLRRLLVEQWESETGRPPQVVRSWDGLRWVGVSRGTSDLDKPECAEFIDWLIATEAGLCE